MNINYFFKNEHGRVLFLRTVLAGLAIAMILFLIGILTIDGIDNKQRYQAALLKKDALTKILQNLEFSGLEGQTEKAIKDYAKLFKDHLNVIITDESGKMVYHLNEGYMSDKDWFMVVVDPHRSYISDAYVVDSKNAVKYQLRLDNGYNSFKLLDNSINNNITKTLFPEKGTVKVESNDENINFTQSSPSQTIRLYENGFYGDREQSDILNYAYIGSRGWNVYSIYKEPLLFSYYPKQRTISDHFLKPLAVTFFLLFWFLLPLWVFFDARRREFKAALWGLFTLATNLIGLLVYLVVRPELIVCKKCGENLRNKYLVCPNCGAKSQDFCPACKQIVKDTWVACPYCGQAKDAQNAGL